MTPHLLLLLLAGGCVLLLTAGRARGTRPRRGFVTVNPRYRAALRRHGLTQFEDFAGRTGLIISGHADREVARLTSGESAGALRLFVKREHRVGWAVRWANARAGFGFVPRSLREARTLEAVRREGVGCPEWVAAGEDGRGRAFLVLRALDAVDLPAFLQEHPDPGRRRRLARALGAALARLHRAGLDHPDLYAKHVLVGPGGDTPYFLDWQRSRRRRAAGGRLRARDLAALHATLPEALASPRERLAFLRAYLRAEPVSDGPSPGLWDAARAVEGEAQRLLRRRHVREKLRPAPGDGAAQDWTCLEGEALCVTSALGPAWPAARPGVLELGPPPPAPVTRRWLAVPGAPPALLVRRRSRRPLAALWCWLRRRPLVSPEQRQAALLFRLQRYAVPTPRVLAMGQRRGPFGRQDSFLLTEPAADAVRLDAWLALGGRAAAGPARRQALWEAGALLGRLHEAGCYLRGGCPLAIRAGGPGPAVVLGGVDEVEAPRAARPRRARHDLAAVSAALAASGCGGDEIGYFLAGYAASPAGRGGEAALSPRPAGGAARHAAGRPAPFAGYTYPPRDGLWERLVRGTTRVRQRDDWAAFAGPGWEGRVLDVAFTRPFHTKQGRSVGRWVLDAPGDVPRRLTVYLKRHHRQPWWQGVLAALWPGRGWSPALRECAHLEWARRQGLPVPEVVAAGEHIGPWGRLRSFLAVEELAGMVAVDEAIPLAAARLGPAAFRAWKRGLLGEMARLTRLLHDRRCFHKDLYLCHFYVARADAEAAPAGGWAGRVYLIDLHRLARHPLAWRLWQVKDLAQLLYSSEAAGVTVRDRVAFWRAYRDVGPRRRGERRLWGWVLFKWARYRRHNARVKARAAAAAGRAGRREGRTPEGGPRAGRGGEPT
jgi:heptose I phosphotransferase